jgi:hypothetical protein
MAAGGQLLAGPRNRKNRAGQPATTVPGSTSLVTTAPAPTSAPSPMVTPARITAPLPTDAPRLTRDGTTLPYPSIPCGARVRIVDEYHPMPDEHFILDGDAFAEERMAGNPAASTDHRILFDLDKRINARVVADSATAEMDERPEGHTLAELNCGVSAAAVIERGTVGHGVLRGKGSGESTTRPPWARMLRVVSLLRGWRQFDPSLLESNRLDGVQLIEDQASARAGKNGSPRCHRRKPAQMEIGHQTLAVVNVDVGNVLDARLAMGASAGGNAPRRSANDLIDHGQIIRCKLANYIDVLPEAAWPRPNDVDVVRFAQFAGIDNVADATDGVLEQIRMRGRPG